MIADDATIKIYVTAKVKETEQFFAKDEIYQIDKPDIELKVRGHCSRLTKSSKVNACSEIVRVSLNRTRI